MKYLSAIIFSIAIVVASYFLGSAYIERANTNDSIKVTGAGNSNFTSDLIVWNGTFSRFSKDLKQAYEGIALDKEIVNKYLEEKGIKEGEVIFDSVNTIERTKSKYENGNFVGQEFEGYELRQSIKVESTQVELIEKVAREITELLNRGVQFNSTPPRYYYTKLADLKIEMISKATEDAKLRAERIAKNAGGKLGKLKKADMGVFQITGRNSGEDYSWSGAYNTSSKKKTASITMRLDYEIE
ncbi:SIMPL domain-containing protein [Mesonia sp. K4-1]|uniref:SIMPL domain-containing protein n=1 Tax=Mesonia sp. K4-1 TaxID=2602760 RepID=UPI0011C7FE42|nr:SIMPL domain-containing protein [Mesonia sp. K4-1]TXK74995.1 SIMPL domain-containing protein [Mesonia sp. K4-1]